MLATGAQGVHLGRTEHEPSPDAHAEGGKSRIALDSAARGVGRNPVDLR